MAQAYDDGDDQVQTGRRSLEAVDRLLDPRQQVDVAGHLQATGEECLRAVERALLDGVPVLGAGGDGRGGVDGLPVEAGRHAFVKRDEPRARARTGRVELNAGA